MLFVNLLKTTKIWISRLKLEKEEHMALKKYLQKILFQQEPVRRMFVMPSGQERTSSHIVSNEEREEAKTNILDAENPKRRWI